MESSRRVAGAMQLFNICVVSLKRLNTEVFVLFNCLYTLGACLSGSHCGNECGA